ncbi:MAG: biotin--[acetyl-CoA-carboxylase] ligase [Polyangiaceae bacterium UTPRO1]|jgi:BirA family biotin operon repressor/biotin-[acetyl-CoA-carboxylase] ligase|nr:biotin--[acetyl-CoA-carboxylase] ligase [Myxococcales bacterium]OQY66957.1 MAG: biotin--[acetyl-CoA-carboxylase] ligase [Polyangiaceae bacterium UTPRO1]
MDTAERILRLLRQAPVVSGEVLSSNLGVSRAAVWKHVEALRASGYRIAALHARGYALTGVPDRLLPTEIEQHLTTERFGRRLECFETIDSTNLRAAALARAGAPEGMLVLAEQQTAGRGRLGRSWVSPARVNLYASFILRPRLVPADAPQLALAAAVAVVRALRALPGLAPERIAIKWPNDCLLDGRKIAGVLTEMDAEADRIRSVVLGIGVNLNAPARAFPPALRATATSVLLATGTRVDRPRFAAGLCAALEAVYDRVVGEGFAALAPEWEASSCLTGRSVRIEGGGRCSTGTVRGIDAAGRLVVAGPAGEERIMAGDVTIVDGYRMLAAADEERGR